MALNRKIYNKIELSTNRSLQNKFNIIKIIFFLITLRVSLSDSYFMNLKKLANTHLILNIHNRPFFIYNSKFDIINTNRMINTKKRCLTSKFEKIIQNSPRSSNNSFNIPYSSISEIKLQFSDQESALIDLLKSCASYHKINTVFRIAGGWVRDKILGFACKDIDIALSDMTGVQFASLLSDYYFKNKGKSINFGIIEKKPEQSKHLQTAALQIGGLHVDFVNLRHDSYTCDDNRIPEIRIGTEKEDAYRRDFTINSLFYNINTSQVEDFTGMGLEDLKKGIVRTPLDPLVTFLDDPLRVVRAIRFATRFGFNLTDEIIDAASKEEVTSAFIKKVTRSRLSTEIYSILKSSDQSLSLYLLYKFNILPWLVESPKGVDYTTNTANLVDDNSWIKHGIRHTYIGKQLFSNTEHRLPFYNVSDDVIDSFYLALFLRPIYNIHYLTNKLKPVDLIDYIIKESLKLHKRHYNQSKELNTNAEYFNKFIDNIDDIESFEREELGYTIRTCGKYWKESFLINFISHVYEYNDVKNDDYVSFFSNFDKYAYNHLKLYEKIIEMNLENAHEIQPILNGGDIKKILPNIPEGYIFKDITIDHIKYILKNPSCTTEESCEYLINKYKDFT